MHEVDDFTGMFWDSKEYDCKLDPIKNKMRYYTPIINNTTLYFEKFNNMFRGWSYDKKPTWYKKIIQIAKKTDLIKNYTL
jgi:hypothetical protein